MKKYLSRVLLFAALILLYAASRVYFSAAEKKANEPVTFTFMGELSERVVSNYQITKPLRIENVLIAGTFSGWDPFDENYFMSEVSNGCWQIELNLPQGINYYKFVIFVSNTEDVAEWANGIVWAEDVHSKKLVDDNFNGFNSVCSIPDINRIRSIFDFFLLWVIFGMLFLFLFEIIMKWIMRYKLSLKYKIVLIAMLMLVLSNIFIIYYSRYQRKTIEKYSVINTINTLHSFLIAEGADFNDLDNASNLTNICNSLDRFLERTQRRYTFRYFSNNQNFVSTVFIANTNGNMLVWSMIPQEQELYQYSLPSEQQLNTYFTNGLILMHDRYFSKNSHNDICLYTADYTANTNYWQISDHRYFQSFYELLFANNDAAYYPIMDHYQFVGYYIIFFRPESFVESDRSMLTVSLLILLFMIVIFGVLNMRLSEIILVPLNDLVNGMNRVRKGDLDYRVRIQSSDELSVMGDTYNFMTDELSSSREKLEDYAKNLENKVEERTAELKAAQKQMIVQEKLASLGSMTAGIAHEIQNPLNFVNNFATVTIEMIDELKKSIAASGNTGDTLQIISEIEANLGLIEKHGKRAGNIVAGMLLHSRSVSETKIDLDINKSIREYVDIVLTDYRRKYPGVKINLETDYDPNLKMISVYAQDIVRVFTNLLTNACYAVCSRSQTSADQQYVPILKVTTKLADGKAVIRVWDNGLGIPEDSGKKIFTPFFTTKPTGEGIGLGLSMSYDIVVHEHGGDLRFESKPGTFTEFTVILPA